MHHQIRLAVHRAPSRTIEQLDVAYQSGFLLDQLYRLPVEAAVLDDFQRYVLSRIGVIQLIPSTLLDPLPTVTVTQLCHAAGRDLLQRRGLTGTPTDVQRRAAGFEMLGHGKDGLVRIITEMRRGMTPSEMASRIIPLLLTYLIDASDLQRSLGGNFPTFWSTRFSSSYLMGQARFCWAGNVRHSPYTVPGRQARRSWPYRLDRAKKMPSLILPFLIGCFLSERPSSPVTTF